MARIVLGIGSSHAPQLATPPEHWDLRGKADRKNNALIYKGKEYTFDELNKLRGAAFADQIGLADSTNRH